MLLALEWECCFEVGKGGLLFQFWRGRTRALKWSADTTTPLNGFVEYDEIQQPPSQSQLHYVQFHQNLAWLFAHQKHMNVLERKSQPTPCMAHNKAISVLQFNLYITMRIQLGRFTGCLFLSHGLTSGQTFSQFFLLVSGVEPILKFLLHVIVSGLKTGRHQTTNGL